MKVKEARRLLAQIDDDVELSVWPQGGIPRPLRFIRGAHPINRPSHTRWLEYGEEPGDGEVLIIVALADPHAR